MRYGADDEASEGCGIRHDRDRHVARHAWSGEGEGAGRRREHSLPAAGYA